MSRFAHASSLTPIFSLFHDTVWFNMDAITAFTSKLGNQLRDNRHHTSSLFSLLMSALLPWIYSIITEGDADRVWSCIENAVQLMVSAAEEEEDQQ